MKEWLKPIVVLTAICIVVSAALTGTYKLTKPLIDEQKAAQANEGLLKVLPNGNEFEEVTVEIENVTKAYRETNGNGYVVQASGKGFKGLIEAMVGFDADGKVAGVYVLDVSTETAGIGDQVTSEDFQNQFIGKDSMLEGVETISGATFSSKGVMAAVSAAYQAYGEMAGVAVSGPVKEIVNPDDELIAEMLGADFVVLEDEIEGVDSAYQSSKGYAFNTSASGFSGDIHVLVAIDNNGAIIMCKMYQHTETPNEYEGKDGTKLTKSTFSDKWIGMTGDISDEEMPAYTGATYTSNAYKACVRAAFDAFNTVKGA